MVRFGYLEIKCLVVTLFSAPQLKLVPKVNQPIYFPLSFLRNWSMHSVPYFKIIDRLVKVNTSYSLSFGSLNKIQYWLDWALLNAAKAYWNNMDLKNYRLQMAVDHVGYVHAHI